jgi:polyhydroxybutyrate depolymerase
MRQLRRAFNERLCRTVAFAISILVLAPADASADDVLEVTHQGITRTAILHQGAGANELRPLIVALHGLGGTGRNFQAYAQLDVAADRDGFVVVYPDAIEILPNRRWRASNTIDRRSQQFDV